MFELSNLGPSDMRVAVATLNGKSKQPPERHPINAVSRGRKEEVEKTHHSVSFEYQTAELKPQD